MHLGIMPQRLKMADANHRRGDGFLINNAAFIKGCLHTEPFGNPTGQHFQLHLTHELNMNFAQRFVPHYPQQGILFFQQTKR